MQADSTPPSIEPDELLGLADVDPDNFIDLCMSSISPLADGQQSLVRMNCGGPFAAEGAEAGVVFDPAGDPCRRQTVLLASATGAPSSFSFVTEGANASVSVR